MEFWSAVGDFCKNSQGLYTSKQYNTLLSYTFWLQGLKDTKFLSQTAVTTLPFLTWEKRYFVHNLSSGNTLNFYKQIHDALRQEKHYSESFKLLNVIDS